MSWPTGYGSGLGSSFVSNASGFGLTPTAEDGEPSSSASPSWQGQQSTAQPPNSPPAAQPQLSELLSMFMQSQQQQQQQQQFMQFMQQQAQQGQQAPPRVHATHPSYRNPDVGCFSGKPVDFNAWKAALSLHFSDEPLRFASDTTRVNYAARRIDLHSKLFPALAVYLNASDEYRPDWLDDCPLFLGYIQQEIGMADEKVKAKKKIRSLKQAGPVARYFE